MKIGLDVMGGDFAPEATIAGALMAIERLPSDDIVYLFGPESVIQNALSGKTYNAKRFEIVDCKDVVEMGEQPTRAFAKKPDSGIFKGLRYAKEGKINGFAGAGNTGAMLVGAVHLLNQIPGIIRPVISTIVPFVNGGTGMLMDVGLNPDAKPDVLYQYAIIGSLYAKHVMGIENPKVGLLNIGEEEEKGNLLVQATYRIMKDTDDFNFVGNIEGNRIFTGQADVIVCDGFTGNIVLKEAEGIYYLMKKMGISNDFFDRFNYENYGGTPILGINGTAIVGHGMSSPKAIMNMILQTAEICRAGLGDRISAALQTST